MFRDLKTYSERKMNVNFSGFILSRTNELEKMLEMLNVSLGNNNRRKIKILLLRAIFLNSSYK